MKKPIMSKRRFEGGGEVEDKAAGLEASNKEKPMGFFERLRMGNIDDPESEAYKRLGAGRGAAERIPVEDVKPVAVEEYRSDPFGAMTQAQRDARLSLEETKERIRGEEQGKRQPSGDASVAEEMASKPDQPKFTPRPSMSVRPTIKPAPAKETAPEKTTSSEKKSSDSDKASSTKKMEEDMKNYKPRYTPPLGSVPKTTTQKHPPKVFMPERPDNSFPGSKYKLGGSVSKASSRADGIAQRGKTRGAMR